MKFLVVLFFVLFVDLVMAQQTVDKIKVNNLNLPSESASSALLINGSKQVKASASVSSTELEYLDGVSSAIQTQLNAKAADSDVMKLTTDQSASGVKTFTGKTVASSTSNGFRPCPVMTQGQRDLTSPASGDCVYNSTNNKWNIYNGTAWKEAGGGAGGTRLQLMSDPSFEDGVTEGTCTGCTATSETSVVLVTPTNEKSGKAAFSASAGDYKVTKTTSSQFASAQGYVRCQIKTNQSGVEFKAYVDGVNNDNAQDTVDVIGDSVWRPYEIAIVHGSTSAGWAIDADSSITGDIYFDECAVVVGEVGLDVAQAQLAVSGYFAGTAASNLSRTSATLGAFTTVTAFPAPTYAINDWGCATTDANKFAVTCDRVPPGKVVFTVITTLFNSASTNSRAAIFDGTTQSTGHSTNGGSGTGNLYPVTIKGEFVYTSQGSRTFEPYVSSGSGSVTLSSDDLSGGNPRFWIEYYPPAAKIYSQACNDLRACENTFTAKLSSTGVVSAENLDWINGNCVQATGLKTCTLNTSALGLTTGMVCTYTANASTHIPIVQTSNSTTVAVENANTAGVTTAGAGELRCTKAPPDYKDKNQITGTFANVVTAPGISKPKTCYVQAGGATAGTACSAGTCTEYFDNCGTATTTFSSTGIYQMVFSAGTFAASSYAIPKASNGNAGHGCFPYVSGWRSGSDGSLTVDMRCSITSGGSDGTLTNTFFTVEVDGQAP